MNKSFYDMMTGVFKGKENLLRLIDNGGDVNARDGKGKTVLMYVCQFGDLLTAKILINHGADINAKDNMGRTALMYISTSYGYGYACNYILESRFIVQAYGRGSVIRGYLNRIIECRRVFMVEYLIKLGALVNERDMFDKTVLMYACEYGDVDLVNCLLQAKASIEVRDRKGKTALIHACSHFGGKEVGLVKHLLDVGANVNESDYLGVTPLMCASKFDNLGIMKYLIKEGARVDKKNNAGRTALMCACKCGNLESIKVLVDNKANVNEKDLKGKTVLMHLVDSFYDRKLEAVKYIIECGARINDRDIYGRTVLMYACEYRKIDIVQYLLDAGADINVCDIDNRSLLSHIFIHVHPQIVKLLVENNIKMNLQKESAELIEFLKREADNELERVFNRREISGGIPKLVLRIYHETQGIEALLNIIYNRIDNAWKINVTDSVDDNYWGKFSYSNIVRTVDVVSKFSIKNRILERTQWMLREEIKKIKKMCNNISDTEKDIVIGADVTKQIIMERIEPNRRMLSIIKKEKYKLQEGNSDIIKDMLICAKNFKTQ